MPGIDLSTLNGSDLQRLLKIARERNDGPLIDQLEWEIAARGLDPGPAPSRGPEPFATSLEDDPDDQGFSMGPLDPEPFVLPSRSVERRPPRRGLALVGLGVVLGAGLAGAAFWGMSQMAPAPTPRIMAVQAAAPAAPPPIAAAPEATAPALETPPESNPQVKAADATATPLPPPQLKAKPAPPPVRLAKTDATPRRSARGEACARATPAVVCKDPSLRQADAALREAYIRALNSNADPEVLDAGQAAWRRARDEASAPEDLARLYRERTRELDAAAAEARAKLGPG